MPAPGKKISSSTLDSCDRDVACTVQKSVSTKVTSARASKPEEKIAIEECMNPCAKDNTGSAKPPKNASAKGSKECCTAKEKQAVLSKEPCQDGRGSTCQLARPDSADAKARVDKTKPGCINYESCDDNDEAEEDANLAPGCIKYEDCRSSERREKEDKSAKRERKAKKERKVTKG